MGSLVGILPLLCLVIIYILLCCQDRTRGLPLRQWLLLAAVIWGLVIVVITEGTSLIGLFTHDCLIAIWGGGFIASSVVLVKYLNKQVHVLFDFPRVPVFLNFLLFGVLGILLILGLIAIIAPPNNWDSMTYHMSRVMHWIQNQNVGYYPTNNERQLHQSPWGEFAIAQLQILAQSDRWANLIQWFGMLGSIFGISLIAQELGADMRGQILSVAIAVTLPMGIMQASSTQNDLVVGFWLICLAYFVLAVRRNLNWCNALGAGGSLGLALLSKGTAYIYAIPFVVWLGASLFRNLSWKGFRFIILIGFIAATTNLGYFQRNFSLYASPLGPGSESMTGDFTYVNEVLSLSAFSSNIVRNVALHLGTPFDSVNQWVEGSIVNLHKYILLIDPNDPRTTWTGTQFHIVPTSNHEDTAGNPLHFMLILYAIVFLSVQQDSSKRILSSYAMEVCAAFLLFALVLKWQPWHSRLHLPFFLLSMPFVGIVLSKVSIRHADLIVILLMLFSLPWIVYNSSRPLIGNRSVFVTPRIEQYFRNRPALLIPYMEAIDLVQDRGCSTIGLSIGGDDWEYPFWVLMQESGTAHFRIEHVCVQSRSATLNKVPPFDSFKPCMIVSLSMDMPIELTIGTTVYTKETMFPPISLYIEQPRD